MLSIIAYVSYRDTYAVFGDKSHYDFKSLYFSLYLNCFICHIRVAKKQIKKDEKSKTRD